MESNIEPIISAIKIIKKENPESEALPLLKDALKKSMKFYILDMASMGSVIEMEEIKNEFRNGLQLVEVMNK